MKNRIEKIMEKYSHRDFEALRSIYNYRCLSFNQIYELHYKRAKSDKRDVKDDYFRRKLKSFLEDGLIEKEICVNLEAIELYSLTTDGVTAIKKHFGFPSNVYDENRRLAQKGYLTASEVKVAYRFMTHQYNLNQFVIETSQLLNKYNIPNEYFDEKRIPPSQTIRPDGLTKTEKFDIFYEMDMGTETENQLNEKWQHYRAYLRSSANDPSRKKIILFICYERKNMNNRINLIKNSVSRFFMDCLGDDVELYIGTPKKLMAVIRTKFVHNYFDIEYVLNKDLRSALIQKGFQIANGKQLSGLFDGTDFLYYIKHKDGREYMVEEFFGEPMSAMNHAYYYNSLSLKYREQYKKGIPLIIVGTNEDAIMKNCKVFNIESNSVFFTTIKRLQALPFHSAIFKVSMDNMYCFNEDFSNTILASPLES